MFRNFPYNTRVLTLPPPLPHQDSSYVMKILATPHFYNIQVLCMYTWAVVQTSLSEKLDTDSTYIKIIITWLEAYSAILQLGQLLHTSIREKQLQLWTCYWVVPCSSSDSWSDSLIRLYNLEISVIFWHSSVSAGWLTRSTSFINRKKVYIPHTERRKTFACGHHCFSRI